MEESNTSLRHERVQSESGKGKTRGIMSGQNVKITGKQVPYGFNIGRSLPFCSKTAAIQLLPSLLGQAAVLGFQVKKITFP